MNNRIDLTQFDAITKGDWEVIDTPRGGIGIVVRQSHGHNPVVTFTQSMGAQVRNISRDVADMNAIAAVPRLIAELKRCYDLIDRYDSTVSLLANGEDSTGCEGDLTVVNLSACHALYDLRDLSQRVG